MKSVLKAALVAALLWSMPAGATIVQRYAVRFDPFGPDLIGAATNVLLDPQGAPRIVGQYAGGLLVAGFDITGNMLWSQELPGVTLAPSGQWAPNQGAAIDAQGTVYVITADGRLLLFNLSGILINDFDMKTVLTAGFRPVALSLDSAGRIYVAGHIDVGGYQQNMILARLGIGFNPAFIRELDRNQAVDQVVQLRPLPQGGVVMAGMSGGNLSMWGYDAAGNRVLDVSGPAMTVTAVDVSATGEVTVAGSTVDGSAIVSRYDAAGAFRWTASPAGYRGFTALRTASDGSLYAAGHANLDLTMDKYHLVRFSSSGQELWERTYGPYGDSFVYAMELDRDEPVITGEYGFCYGQIMTMKHSAAGDLVWQVAYQPPQTSCGSVNYGLALALDAQRNVHVAGYTLDTSTAVGSYPFKPTLLKYADVDLTPPTTTATLTGTSGGLGWYRSNVTVALKAVDAPDVTSGVKELRYSVDGGATVVVPADTASVTFTTDGAHWLTVQAVDVAGNVEPAQVVQVQIDKVKPTATITATPNVLKPANGRMVAVLVNGTAADARSGVASTTFTVADEYGLVQPALSAFGQTIQLQASRKASDTNGRVYTITVRVTDLAGNVTTASTKVTVP